MSDYFRLKTINICACNCALNSGHGQGNFTIFSLQMNHISVCSTNMVWIHRDDTGCLIHRHTSPAPVWDCMSIPLLTMNNQRIICNVLSLFSRIVVLVT
ncbi:hypothetical protein TNCV_4416471 [Trichonephila clavipes]|uniref:Uncharacterized protein n=1 Tax=Trichonephila clavipes TaxID=2585209 RepID=A0A8X6RZA5_TRICX|nr:hypothetical protein TNCV_4416471 [Trichonephila clavipes]